MAHPAPNSELTAESVKLLKAGDVLRRDDGLLFAFRNVQGPHGRLNCTGVGEDNPVIQTGAPASKFTFIGRPDADGWIPHDGGPNPVPGCRGYVRFYDDGGGEIHDHTRWADVVAFLLLAAPSVERSEGLGSFSPEEAKIPTVQADDQWAVLEGLAKALKASRAAFAAVSESERKALGVPEFWHHARAFSDALTEDTVLKLIKATRAPDEIIQRQGEEIQRLRELIPAVEAYLMTGDDMAKSIKRKTWGPVLKRARRTTTAAEPGTVGMEAEGRNEPKSASDIAFEAVTEGLCDPKPDVAGARERLALLADVCVAFPHQGATELTIRGDDLKETAEDLRLILSAYDRQGEEIERLRGDRHFLLETLRQIDGVVKDGLDPSKLIAVGLEYGDMDAARARQGGPDHG